MRHWLISATPVDEAVEVGVIVRVGVAVDVAVAVRVVVAVDVMRTPDEPDFAGGVAGLMPSVTATFCPPTWTTPGGNFNVTAPFEPETVTVPVGFAGTCVDNAAAVGVPVAVAIAFMLF